MSSNVLDYKCPSCAAPMHFDSSTQKMKCGSCDTEMEMEAFQAYDEALKATENQFNNPFETYQGIYDLGDEVTTHRCQSCGGELMTDGNTVATECPYCGNVAIVLEKVSDVLRPDFVIPFKIDKVSAKQFLKKFYKNKYLLPKFFKEDNRIDKMVGMYEPVWLFNCDTDSTATYQATRIRSWTSGDRRYTKTSYYLVTRSGTLRFKKIPADGSKKIDDTIMEAIEPYEYEELTPFSTAYLSGFLADKYDVDAEEQKPRIEQRIRRSVDRNLRSTIGGYTTLVEQKLNVNIQKSKIHYALFPIWLLNTRWKQKTYTFALNGQTGKLVGDLPIDWKKATLIGSGILAGTALLLLTLISLTHPKYETLEAMQLLGGIGSLIAALSYLTYLPFWKKIKKNKLAKSGAGTSVQKQKGGGRK